MDEGRAEAALARGARLDEAGPGHGLGLAIVRDLAEASGATLRMDRSMLGGLRAIIAWKSSVF
jgi:signal transduction histidine kinase